MTVETVVTVVDVVVVDVVVTGSVVVVVVGSSVVDVDVDSTGLNAAVVEGNGGVVVIELDVGTGVSCGVDWFRRRPIAATSAARTAIERNTTAPT